MVKAGVNNLNLHQLRMTPHNAPELIKRGYTIINAERPVVLESELAALEITHAAKQQGIGIGINYCSFHFKHRFQKAGFRKIVAQKFFPEADITTNGYLRFYNKTALHYKLIQLSTVPFGKIDDRSVILAGTTYYYNLLSSLNVDITDSYRDRVDMLLAKDPCKAPADPFLFRIWQHEYIEHGIRDY